jgi:signal transduction histidine kinase
VYGARPSVFTEDDIRFALAFAQQGATAIENAVAYGALRRTDEVKSQFVRAVTHELRSPVAGAQSLLRAVTHESAGALTDLQRDVLRRLSDRLDTLQLLINDLLDLAAGKVKGLEAEFTPVSVDAMAAWVVDRLGSQAEDKHLELKLYCAGRGLLVKGTDEGLRRILVNLVGNAIKYTPAGGRVAVTVEPSGADVAVVVADTGMGILPADLPRLFEEFHRGGNAKEAGILGTGLGLAIVKDLVDRSGGRIAVQSTVGQGSTFTVTLPRAGDLIPPAPLPLKGMGEKSS